MRTTTPSARAAAALACSLGVALGAGEVAAQVGATGGDAGTADAGVVADARFAALPALTFRSVNTRDEASVRVYRSDGTVDPDAVATLGRLFHDLATGEPSPVVARTLQLLVRVANHFGVARLDVVSAYRSGLSASGARVHREGYHGVGSAVDFTLVGQDMAVVAAYARTFAHVGVGWYPRENFVHLDSREQSFYWENRSRRHHHGWDRPLDRRVSLARDAAWTPADDAPWDPPGVAAPLVVHPPTQPGAHAPHHHHGHGRHHARPRPPVHVFRGAE